MKKLISTLLRSRLLGRIFHTQIYCLQEELQDCESVLDLGCGPSSPLQFCKNIKYSVGVEAFEPYLEASKKRRIHSEYINRKIEELDFPEGCFDAVIMIEVLEHLPEDIGFTILEKIEKWTRKKIIITSPNGFIAQKAVDSNPLQQHLSGWDVRKMKGAGYVSRGLAGLKWLRQEVQSDTMGDDLMTSIRFEPRSLWFVVATLSQLVTYSVPQLAFELFSVKYVSEGESTIT